VFELLEEYGCALCLHDRAGSVTPREVVGPFVYVRFHGSHGDYQGSYDHDALAEWADWLAVPLSAGRDVYAYFNNDTQAAAVRDALAFRRLLDHRVPPTDFA
jgi:uncharacterized protein YecE (DUF72 family)